MKTQHLPLLLLGCFILSGLFTLSNCKDDCAEKKILLKDLERYVPYTGNDTLRFLHNSTDTQIFVGQGLERFYVTTKKQEDDACPEDHESVRIWFKNTQNNDEIKMEYIFDNVNFNGYTGVNYQTFYHFYYNNINIGKQVSFKYPSPTITINGREYPTLALFIFSNAPDTLSYLMFRRPIDNDNSGILKIKYPGDTLTIIR
jgi:hypothetical protein